MLPVTLMLPICAPAAMIVLAVVMLPVALIVPPVSTLPPVIVPATLAVPPVAKLPPVTVPLAVINPPANTFPEPEISPPEPLVTKLPTVAVLVVLSNVNPAVALAMPLSLNMISVLAPGAAKLPCMLPIKLAAVTLPVALMLPPVFTLPPVMVPVALTAPPVNTFAPVISPVTLKLVPVAAPMLGVVRLALTLTEILPPPSKAVVMLSTLALNV